MKKIVLSVILIVFLFNIFCPVINSTENMIESIEEKEYLSIWEDSKWNITVNQIE